MNELCLPANLPGILVPWYREQARKLPWRETKDPYAIWVSEVMLQQTRVESVKGYYSRFLSAFPTVRALALANLDTLLKVWEGLGYYSRARHMKKAAMQIEAEHGGVFPHTYEAIRSLPGIGPYTAGAIASIAFELPTPAVDGNVLRLIARLTELDRNLDAPATRKLAEKALSAIYPAAGRGDFTQALMELGATICLPNGVPKCAICPLANLCKARENDTTEKYPLRSKRKPRTVEQHTVLILTSGGRIALKKRTDTGLLASMWELPNVRGTLTEGKVLELLQELNIEPIKVEKQGDRKHLFTHVEWKMTCWHVESKRKPRGFYWATQSQLAETYTLPTAFRTCLK